MHRKTIPLAALVLLLSGCGTGGLPTPTPTSSQSPTGASSPVPTEEPDVEVDPLPSNAFLQVTVTAVDEDGGELRLVLTVDEPRVGSGAARELGELDAACPNAISSQLDVYSDLEPTGVVTSTLVATGDWEGDATVAASAGSLIADGVGDNIAPPDDPEGGFGCAVVVITGPGEARLSSLLLGSPSVGDPIDAENALRNSVFGIEDDSLSQSVVTWTGCRIQLSDHAQLIADQEGWDYPAEWGRGCLIGTGGEA